MDIKNDVQSSKDYLQFFTFVDIDTGISAARAAQAILEKVVQKIGEIFSPSICAFLLYDQNKRKFYYKLVEGKKSEELKGFSIPKGKGAAWVLEKEESLLIKNARRKSIRFSHINEKTGLKVKSYVTVPLKLNDKIIGAFEMVNVQWKKKFTSSDLRILASIADCSVSALDNVANLAMLKDISKTDTLTGIHNRKSFEDHFSNEIERCKRHSHPLALMLIDIDNLNRINEQHGHDMGDRVLKDVAWLVKNAVRRIDIAARYDEDEFAVLMPHTTKQEAETVSKRIYDNVMKEANQAVKFMVNLGIGSVGLEKVEDLVDITKEDMLRKKKSE